MKFLLDTHTFLWWITDKPNLSDCVRDIIVDGNNEMFLSAASGWEIVIKSRIGRIQLTENPDTFLLNQLSLNAIQSMPITMRHALYVNNLPDIHKDPFDRIIIAQSILEDMPILTKDHYMAKYNVKVIW